jgi:hypothetical protein
MLNVSMHYVYADALAAMKQHSPSKEMPDLESGEDSSRLKMTKEACYYTKVPYVRTGRPRNVQQHLGAWQ